jgi:hypothetical protein
MLQFFVDERQFSHEINHDLIDPVLQIVAAHTAVGIGLLRVGN